MHSGVGELVILRSTDILEFSSRTCVSLTQKVLMLHQLGEIENLIEQSLGERGGG